MKKPLLLFIVLFLPSSLLAQPIGYSFLRTPVGARPAAMAASFISMSKDIHSIYYNPAGTANFEQRAANFGYLNHILDIQSFFGGYVAPHQKGSYAFAIQYTSYGEFTRTNEFGEEQGTFGANNVVAYLSYSLRQNKKLHLGGNVKYIRSSLEIFSSDAVAIDLGVIYHSGLFGDVDFGAGVFNIGRARSAFIDTKERLPFNFQFGFSKRLEHLPLHYSITAIKYQDESFEFRFGGEFTLATGLYLRLGYDTLGGDQKVGTDRDRFAGLSIGLGLDYRKYKFDYGLSSFGEVGSLNRLSLAMEF